MNVQIKTQINKAKILAERGLDDRRKAQVYLASQVARFCDPYVPMQSGTMKNTRQIAQDGSAIVYPGPYAHYHYVGEVMAGRAPKHYTGRALSHHGAPMRGPSWDKRMMSDHKDEVVDAFAKYVGGKRK